MTNEHTCNETTKLGECQACVDSLAALPEASAADQEWCRAYDAKITEGLRADNLRTWLELEVLKLGTENQRRRHMAKQLSDDELTELARYELFKNLNERRWASRDRDRLTRHVAHVYKPDDDLDAMHEGYDFETADVDVLTVAELRTLKRLEAFAHATRKHPWVVVSGGTVTIATASHWATCRVCLAEHCRSSAKITIEWAGRLLTREYAL